MLVVDSGAESFRQHVKELVEEVEYKGNSSSGMAARLEGLYLFLNEEL